jgi:Carboxypeptidase regulatory-like domain/TonB-dependent Receptor Plug Domain
MHSSLRRGTFAPALTLLTVVLSLLQAASLHAQAKPAPARTQAAGNSGTITGTVTDPSGAVIPNATVTLTNALSGLNRTTTSDSSGAYTIPNLPLNTYRLSVSAPGMAPATQSVPVQSFVPVTVTVALQISAASTVVDVTAGAGDLIESAPVSHTDIDQELIARMPLESNSSAISQLVTNGSPGVSGDSDGQMHAMGDHASNSFSVDGQSITDQTSKTFSNQIPVGSIQSIEVIPGAPPAEYGGKTSLVIVATTRSGLGNSKPHGDLSASYGAFGSSNFNGDVAVGSQKIGNFISLGVLNTGRFIDPPEFHAIHDKGNEENFFDRVDWNVSNANSLHLNLGYTRSWFQTPNSYDTEYATQWSTNSAGVAVGPNGAAVGASDQRAQIQTFNIAPSYTRVLDSATVFNLGGYFRRDAFNYYPSKNPFADLGAPDLQQESIAQQRTLANAGAHTDATRTKGANNIKAGLNYSQTFLTENFQLGIVDPNFVANLGCDTPTGAPIPSTPCATLHPYDLTQGGSLYGFHGHTDIKEFAAYAQDAISAGNWSGNVGLRFDRYNGLAVASQVEPRVALSYKIKPSATSLRVSYARTLESPFNENLIIASEGCYYPVIQDLISPSCVPTPNRPGFRNDFHAGFQQSITRHAVLSADYVWKYTHNGYDFSVLGATPITFPIGWHNSKIPGFDGSFNILPIHGFSAQTVFSSVAARFFTPQTSGLGTVPAPPGGKLTSTAFRIDHDERFNQNTHFQYQFPKRGPWVGLNWRFDSGQVAGSAPCYGVLASNDCPQSTTLNGQPAVKIQDPFGNPLTADQQAQAGFACNGVRATPTHAIPNGICLASQFTSSLINLPAINTENDDHAPPRIAPRNLLDLSIGEDALYRSKTDSKRTLSASLTIANLTDKYTLYNFLSTFSGTHYVAPRAITGELAYHF